MKNRTMEVKERYRELILAATGDVKLADKIWLEMVIRERERKMDGD